MLPGNGRKDPTGAGDRNADCRNRIAQAKQADESRRLTVAARRFTVAVISLVFLIGLSASKTIPKSKECDEHHAKAAASAAPAAWSRHSATWSGRRFRTDI